MDYKEIMPNRHLYHIPSSKLASLDCEDCEDCPMVAKSNPFYAPYI